jgi:hypothetical protein
MAWIPLIEHQDAIWRGAVFRLFPTTTEPYENPVDFMLVENSESESALALMVTTGYKAGITFFHFPKDALASEGARSISPHWLIDNWLSSIYSECAVENILYTDCYVPSAA